MRKLPSQEDILSKWKGNLSHPVVSISCLTYNHENFIEDSLEGFLTQETNFPFEVLIHDDASQDNTQTILRLYEERYPEILKIIYQKENQYNKGRNVGVDFNLKRAQGKYIALCEGDDFWIDSSKLQCQKDFLEKNPDYVLCYTDVQPFEGERVINFDVKGARKDLSSMELQRAASINTPTAFFRNLIQDCPAECCNVRYGDLMLWSRLGDFGKGKYLSSIKPSMYRVHSGGIHSMQTRRKQLQMRLETMMGLYSYRLSQSDYKLADYFLEEVVMLSLKLGGWSFACRIVRRLLNSTGRFLIKPFELLRTKK